MDTSLDNILDDLMEAAPEHEPSVGDVLDAFESRSLGAMLAMLGLVASIPVIGGIPGASIVIGLLVLSVTAQALSGGTGLWLPQRIRDITFDRDSFEKGVDKARTPARWIDKILRPRLGWLVNKKAIGVCAAILALGFFPMAVVPFGVQAPAAAVTLLGLALIGRDGVFAALGYALTLLTIGLSIYALL